MVVYSTPYILDAATFGEPLDKARICYQTYTRTAVPGDITVSSDSASYPKDAPLRPDTYEFWKPLALPATWVLEFNGVQDVNYVGVAAHNLATMGCTLMAEVQVGADPWVQVAVNATPTDNAPVLFLQSTVPANRMRLTVTGAGGMPSIGVIYVGVALAMMKSVSATFKPITMARDTVLQNTMSTGGQFLGQDYRRNGTMGSTSFKHLTAAWVRQKFEPFSKEARKYPYFFAWNPLTYPLEVGYCWTEQDIVAEYEGLLDLMQVSWKMRGLGAE